MSAGAPGLSGEVSLGAVACLVCGLGEGPVLAVSESLEFEDESEPDDVELDDDEDPDSIFPSVFCLLFKSVLTFVVIRRVAVEVVGRGSFWSRLREFVNLKTRRFASWPFLSSALFRPG